MTNQHILATTNNPTKASGLLQRRVSKIDIGDACEFPAKKDPTPDSPENAGVFLRFELKNGILQYQSLMKAASKFKDALTHLAQARSEFSDALKGVSSCRCSGAAGAVNAEQETEENPFKLSSNVYHKIAAKERELISVMVKDFEGPLKKNFETHSNKIQYHDKHYIDLIKKLNDSIKSLERKCSKVGKRNPEKYSKYLGELNSKGTELEKVKQMYVKAALEEERRNFSFLTQKCSLLLKSETDILSDNNTTLQEICPKLVQIAFGIGQDPLPNELLDMFGAIDSSKKVPETALSIIRKTQNEEEIAAASSNELKKKQETQPKAPVTFDAQQDDHEDEEDDDEEENDAIADDLSSIAEEEQENENNLVLENPFSDDANLIYPEKLNEESEDAFNSISSKPPPTAKAALQEIASLSENLRNISFHAAREVKLKQKHSHAVEEKEAEPKNYDQPEYLEILHNFSARQERELTVLKNDIVVLKKRDNNWIYVAKDGKSGWIPKSFAKSIQSC